MALRSIFRIPKPKTFLYLMSLRTGTELINLCLLINKLTGLYGLLAVLTGYHLSAMQISMYIYSIGALVVAARLSPHIRRGASSPLHNVALAWLHVIDAIVNAGYTAAFGIGWFVVLAEHHGSPTPSSNLPTGDKMMSDVAGFNAPSYTVSAVNVVVTSPAGGAHNIPPKQHGHLVGQQEAMAASAGAAERDISNQLLPSGSSASITTMSILLLVRVYFLLVVMAYARAVLRQHIVAASQNSTGFAPPAQEADNGALYADDPFRDTAGWHGKLGRLMIRAARGYWLGVEPGEAGRRNNAAHTAEWARSLSSRFDNRRKVSQSVDLSKSSNGTADREHRRRAGTGPPLLRPIELENVRK